MEKPLETALQAFVRKAIAQTPRARDHFDSLIRRQSGTKGKPLYDLSRGKGLKPSATMLGHMAAALDQPLELLVKAAQGEDVEPVATGLLPSPTDRHTKDIDVEENDTADVQEMDLAYGMGGGTYLDVPVKSTPLTFSRKWLRMFTEAPPEKIFVARGMGDSMMPTILDADIVLIDTSDNRVMAGDKIWAVAYGQTGLIKRLRPMPDGSVKILSDNPSVPSETAYDGELNVVGRVVAIVRKT
ncbi:S24 family peptidase [Sphingobium sp. CECT 9361]|uniref:S24 family peptidase n=1 Tax=Sphingobium sp. CECT 9361 TaxID=2845384 RepID=UPI001E540C7E|nr:S24 family peptidase [Sphingobium sp. CECT 9361]